MMMKTAKIIAHAASEFMKLKYDLLCYTVHITPFIPFNFKARQPI